MTFQAYLDDIEAKTGITPRKFIELAHEQGFDETTKATPIVAWLKEDYGLGQGHAMALVHVITKGPQISTKHVGADGRTATRMRYALARWRRDESRRLSARLRRGRGIPCRRMSRVPAWRHAATRRDLAPSTAVGIRWPQEGPARGARGRAARARETLHETAHRVPSA